MASLREQIFAAVEARLTALAADEAVGLQTFIRNPKDVIGVDQMDAMEMIDGGSPEPGSLTGGVATNELTFTTGIFAVERGGAEDADTAKDKLDRYFVAVSDALLDPDNIQIGGLAVGIFRGAISDPVYGRPKQGAQWMGAQWIDWRVQFWEREGDASSVGP